VANAIRNQNLDAPQECGQQPSTRTQPFDCRSKLVGRLTTTANLATSLSKATQGQPPLLNSTYSRSHRVADSALPCNGGSIDTGETATWINGDALPGTTRSSISASQ